MTLAVLYCYCFIVYKFWNQGIVLYKSRFSMALWMGFTRLDVDNLVFLFNIRVLRVCSWLFSLQYF